MAQKAFTVGGIGAAPGVDDVARVAAGHVVALDAAGAERVKKESPPPKAFAPEDAGGGGGGASPADGLALLSREQSRAALLVRLMTLMAGRTGVRLQVAEFFAELLNRDLAPLLPASDDAAALSALADACKGAGVAAAGEQQQQQQLGAALEAAGVAPPGLSAAERAAIVGGASATAGAAALAIVGGRRLLPLAAAVAALSCEAAGASAKAFDADAVEGSGYKGAAAAADELRALLEGSRAAGSRKGLGAAQQAAYACLPQALGAAGDALAGAYAAVRPEVQSAAPPVKAGASSYVPSPTLAPALLELAHALLGLAHSTLGRVDVLAAVCPAVEPQLQRLAAAVREAHVAAAQRRLSLVGSELLGPAGVAWGGDGLMRQAYGLRAAAAAAEALAALQRAAALEALAAVVVLRLAEGNAAAPAAAAAANGAAAAAAAADGGGDSKQKQQQPAAAKKDRKGAAAGPGLGRGTAVARAHLEAALASAAAASSGSSGSSGTTLSVADGGLPDAAWAGALLGADASATAGVDAAERALFTGRAAAAKLAEELKAVLEANQARRKPKVAKGARDFLPDQMAIREAAFARIAAVFKRHGAVAIDTPVFELRETLTGKYGEDSKLIYDLADQGGELLSLRYDLTVPFARYVAVNAIGNIKRYHIGKVYRRDQPQLAKGRFREFFQCDFDIAGAYASMVPDAEVLKVVIEILTELRLGSAFTIKLNHRKLLDAMLAIAGVPPQKFRPICSAIDKLDKEPWEAVRAEMVEEKGLPAEVADTIGQFVVLKGQPRELLAKLTAPGHPLAQHPDSAAALAELDTLFTFLEAMDAVGPISFDLSLARGLDYYTGVIYEAVLEGAAVGSIAAGGRYDRLVGMFSGRDVPAVGVSIGIERVFAIMEAQQRAAAAAAGQAIRATETEVLVASIGNGMQPKRMALANKLWAAGIKAEFGFKPNPKMGDQLGYALEQGIPFMVLFGDDELARGVVKVKDMAAKEEASVPLDGLVDELRRRLAAAAAGGGSGAGGGGGEDGATSMSVEPAVSAA